jgi:RHS repeat-associated protein
VQDLSYAYDPVGNVTRVTDSADTQDVIFFTNQRVDPTNDYTYDATYRLIAATGREHLGQTQVSNDDSARMNLPQPGDGNAMGVYIESYAYDPVGNILTMAHQVSSGAWTRHYAYATGNRLSTSSLPGDPANGPYAAAYTYDAHGNMLTMPHLPALTWDESDRLRSTTRQAVSTGMPATTYYAYSSTGDRVRKTSTAQTTQRLGVRTIERVYLGPVELVRTFAIDGQTVSIERETLHLMVESHREVIVETRRIGTDKEAATRTRYQYGNVIDSATLELDDQAQIITYEEYFPFGSTSYQAVDAQTETPKRYRYVAKERDEENDLYYYGARYYAPWLGRWASCDPIGIADGLNVYAYVHDNPIKLIDPTGTQSEEEPAPPKFQPSLETIPSGPYDTGTVASNNALAEKAEAGIQFQVGHGTLPHMSDEDLASLGLEPPPSDLDEPPEPAKPPAPPPPSNLWVVDKQFSALAGFDPASLGEAVALQGQFVLPHMTLTRLIQGKESAKLGTLFSHEFNLAYGAAPGLTFQGQYLHPQRTTGTADAPYYPGTLQGGLTFNALDLSIKSDKNDSSPKGTPDTRIDLQISAAIQEQLLLREGPNQILFSATATQLSAGIALEYHLTDADSIAAQAGIQSTDWGSSFSAATIFLQYIHHTDPQ